MKSLAGLVLTQGLTDKLANGTFSPCRSSRISPTAIEFLGPALSVKDEQANQLNR